MTIRIRFSTVADAIPNVTEHFARSQDYVPELKHKANVTRYIQYSPAENSDF